MDQDLSDVPLCAERLYLRYKKAPRISTGRFVLNLVKGLITQPELLRLLELLRKLPWRLRVRLCGRGEPYPFRCRCT